MKIETHEAILKTEIEVVYKKGLSNKVVLLLHGFRQTNSWIYKSLESSIPDEYTILSINAPFLIPRRNPNLMTKSYAWYFFNDQKTEYLITMDKGVSIIKQMLEIYTSPSDCIIPIGFSQGGYIAPFYALEDDRVPFLIQISARLRSKICDNKMNFKVYALHGEKDHIISLERSQQCFNEFSKINEGEFHVLQDMDHEINTAAKSKIFSILNSFK
ncbi:MAG: putative esterase [Thermoproteota archaeon]|jgi:predicted esterase